MNRIVADDVGRDNEPAYTEELLATIQRSDGRQVRVTLRRTGERHTVGVVRWEQRPRDRAWVIERGSKTLIFREAEVAQLLAAVATAAVRIAERRRG